jgi:hypothetical protein
MVSFTLHRRIFWFVVQLLIRLVNILVDSNDRLYLGDDEFCSEAVDYCSQLLTELLNDINQLGNENQYRKQVWQPVRFPILIAFNGHNISFVFVCLGMSVFRFVFLVNWVSWSQCWAEPFTTCCPALSFSQETQPVGRRLRRKLHFRFHFLANVFHGMGIHWS